MSNFCSTKKLLAAVAGTTVLASQAFGASFSIKEQNTTYLGTAYAGTAALATDASTGVYNPAGLAYLQNDQITGSFVGIYGDFKVHATQATATFYPAPGQMVTPGTAESKGWNIVPAFYYGKKVNDKIAFSINTFSPFGLKTSYEQPHPGRYLATLSKLQTVAFGPAVSYRWSERLSLGFGLDFMYAKAWLFQDVRIPFGVMETCSHTRADDTTVGWRVGAIYQLSDDTRMGFNYRHKYVLKMTGESVDGVSLNRTLRRRNMSAGIELPELITYSVTHQYDDNWTVMADVEWTHWSRLKELVLDFDDGQGQRLPLYYKNVWRVALGTQYRYNSCWMFKAGMAFDDAPTRDEHRSLRIPDTRRIWVGIGTQYRINQAFTAEVAYAHLFFKKATLNDRAPIVTGGTQTGQSLDGTMEASANLLGVQLVWNIV